MTLLRRLERLERGHTAAPAGCVVSADGAATVVLHATGERLPLEEYRRCWPRQPALKAYTDERMVNALAADWSDAPPPRSSADRRPPTARERRER